MDAPKIPRKNATGPLTSNSLSPFHHAHSPMMEEDRSRRAASVLSMDDIEAAQALEGLRSGTICRAYRSWVGSAVVQTTQLTTCRLRPVSSSITTIPSHRFTGPTTARASTVATDILSSPYILCDQRLRVCVRNLEVVLAAFQVRRRIY